MSNFVKIENGVYRNQPIEGVFPLVKPTLASKFKPFSVTAIAKAPIWESVIDGFAIFDPNLNISASEINFLSRTHSIITLLSINL